jgi:nucleotide-binding universal stress UspA family protein
MVHTIAVGVDGSQPSEVALCWAAARAEHVGARLFVAHVVGQEADEASELPAAVPVAEPDRAALDSRVASEELVRLAADRASAMAPPASVETVLLSGDPMWSLARAFPAVDALVVGSHKTGFLRGEAYGSRSLHLIAAATVPVITVPAGTDRTGRGIVVGIDDSPSGRAALAFAAHQAELTGQELVLVRATPSVSGEHRDSVNAPAHARSSRLEATRALVAERWPNIRVRSRLVYGPPAPALVRSSSHAALLVVGASRAEFGEPFVVGRVTHDVLLNRSAPTAVVDGTRDGLGVASLAASAARLA